MSASGREVSLSQSPERPLNTLYANDNEHRHFSFFTTEAARRIAGVLDQEFWTTLVPQLSHHDVAVKYAAISIASLFRQHFESFPESPSSSSSSSSSGSDKSSMALGYYNKSLNATIDSKAAAQTALITCILFFCIEALQGHETEALHIYHQGQKLLDRTMAQSDTPGAHSSVPVLIATKISPIFARLRVQAALFGPPYQSDDGKSHTRSGTLEPFTSILAARTSLFDLTTDVHDHIVHSSRGKWVAATPDVVQHLESRGVDLRSELDVWHSRFTRSGLSKLVFEDSSSDPYRSNTAVSPATAVSNRIASTILTCHYVIIDIWLECALSFPECSYDSYTASFEHLLELAAQVVHLTNAQNNGTPPIFQFEIGVIPPLYMAARKCRDPMLRRRAIDLLRQAPKQEGLWESGQMAAVAERIVEIEEQDLEEGHWPSEEMRVHEVLNELQSTNKNGVKGHVVTFLRKRWGMQGEWESWTEWFEGYQYMQNSMYTWSTYQIDPTAQHALVSTTSPHARVCLLDSSGLLRLA